MLVWAWALPAPAETATAPVAADNLRHAAASLKRSAAEMIVTPDAPRRAARLVALCRYVFRLLPDDGDTHRIFAYVIYPGQDRLRSAAKAVDDYLAVRPADHAAALRWLDLTSSGKNTAEARLAYLASVSADSSKSSALRAEADARRGHILVGRGLADEADKAFTGALKLDAGNATALAGRLSLLPTPATPADRARLLLADLRANAARAATANELADLLQAAGLHKLAVDYYRHLYALANQPGSTRRARHLATVRLCNAMLDAGQARQVTKLLPPALRIFGASVDLRSLLVEAWRTVGSDEKAEEQITAIESIYSSACNSGRVSAATAGELAMFFLITKPDARRAGEYAEQVVREAKDDPVAQRLLGGAEIASGKPDLVSAGRKRLEKILDRDLYAAVLLAKHHFAAGNSAAGAAALKAAMKLPRGGPACRQMIALAAANKVPVAEVKGRSEISTLVTVADARSLKMAVAPAGFITITVQPVGKAGPGPLVRLEPGDPVAVVLTLKNTSGIPIPLGRRGLLEPVVKLDVTVEGAKVKKPFTDLPLCVWPAPRYLQPGKAVHAFLRLDVGGLGRVLAETPLKELILTVNLTVSPVKPFGTVISALPMKVKPVRIVRSSLLGTFDRSAAPEWPKRYQYALRVILNEIKQGDLAQRMRAARKVAALLALARGIERGTAEAPMALRGHVTKPIPLTMLREMLKDPNYAVRAEMIAALGNVPLDKHIKRLLAVAAGDPHPLVRFRLAELYAAARPGSVRTVMAALAKDKDELVRMMARAYRAR